MLLIHEQLHKRNNHDHGMTCQHAVSRSSARSKRRGRPRPQDPQARGRTARWGRGSSGFVGSSLPTTGSFGSSISRISGCERGCLGCPNKYLSIYCGWGQATASGWSTKRGHEKTNAATISAWGLSEWSSWVRKSRDTRITVSDTHLNQWWKRLATC